MGIKVARFPVWPAVGVRRAVKRPISDAALRVDTPPLPGDLRLGFQVSLAKPVHGGIDVPRRSPGTRYVSNLVQPFVGRVYANAQRDLLRSTARTTIDGRWERQRGCKVRIDATIVSMTCITKG